MVPEYGGGVRISASQLGQTLLAVWGSPSEIIRVIILSLLTEMARGMFLKGLVAAAAMKTCDKATFPSMKSDAFSEFGYFCTFAKIVFNDSL